MKPRPFEEPIPDDEVEVEVITGYQGMHPIVRCVRVKKCKHCNGKGHEKVEIEHYE